MNFYKRHIGDYIKETSHLSLLEHGVYNRLLDVYYARESGIPDDQAARLIGARAPAEKKALRDVLNEFFVLTEGQWIKQSCEDDIESFKEKADRNREVGKKGGRPRKMGSQTEPTNNPDGFFEEPKQNPFPVASNQKPVTSNQKREESLASARATPGLDLAAFDRWNQYRSEIRKPLKPSSLRAAAEELTKFNGEQSAVVQQSIANGWQGLFPLKSNAASGQKSADRKLGFTIDPDGNDKNTIRDMLAKGSSDRQIFEALDCMRSMQWINDRKREIASEQH